MIGKAFFESLVEHLRSALDAECVYAGEFTSGQAERVQTLAACGHSGLLGSLDFPLAGSPDAEVAAGGMGTYSDGAADLFPSALLLGQFTARSFVGIPLNDDAGRPAGILAAVFRNALGEQVHFINSILLTFGPRAAAELMRKQSEDALIESAQRYRAFILQNTDAMWRIEFEEPIDTTQTESEQVNQILRYGYLAECNDALAALVGADSVEHLIGSRLVDVFPPHSGGAEESAAEALLAFVRSKYRDGTVELSRVNSQGKHIHLLRTQWGIVANGKLQRIWGSSRDITELRRSQRDLVTAERRLTDVLESVHLFAVRLAADETLSFCNKYLITTSGWHANDILGKNWFDLMIASGDRQSVRECFGFGDLNPEPFGHCEANLVLHDGENRLVEWDSVALRDASGSFVGAAAIGRDVTDYRYLDARIRKAEKLEMVGQLAGGIAHDFNNLLTVILGYSSLMLNRGGQLTSQSAELREIQKAAEKGAALTRKLLAFSQRKPSEPKRLNLNTVIEDMRRLLKTVVGDKIMLTLDLDSTLEAVVADPDDMDRVLLNLALNARDAMPNGGRLIIATANLNVDNMSGSRLAGVLHGRYVRIIVADTGTGMTEEVRAHLFEPFYSTKGQYKGSGLGLSVAYGIVLQSGGHILVDSAPGEGSAFEILLPRAEGPETPAPAEQ
jgi:PAS domain S-box-containing protein